MILCVSHYERRVTARARGVVDGGRAGPDRFPGRRPPAARDGAGAAVNIQDGQLSPCARLGSLKPWEAEDSKIAPHR